MRLLRWTHTRRMVCTGRIFRPESWCVPTLRELRLVYSLSLCIIVGMGACSKRGGAQARVGADLGNVQEGSTGASDGILEVRALSDIYSGPPAHVINRTYCLTGMGLFVEGFTLFSIGNLASLFKASVIPHIHAQPLLTSTSVFGRSAGRGGRSATGRGPTPSTTLKLLASSAAKSSLALRVTGLADALAWFKTRSSCLSEQSCSSRHGVPRSMDGLFAMLGHSGRTVLVSVYVEVPPSAMLIY